MQNEDTNIILTSFLSHAIHFSARFQHSLAKDVSQLGLYGGIPGLKNQVSQSMSDIALVSLKYEQKYSLNFSLSNDLLANSSKYDFKKGSKIVSPPTSSSRYHKNVDPFS